MISSRRCGYRQQSSLRLVLAAVIAAGVTHDAVAASNDIDITLDEAKLIRLERPVAEIIVGNPSIADVAVQSGKLLVVTGKSYGRTNVIVIDADGKEIINKNLSVEAPRTGLVTIYRSTIPFSYYCAPNCVSALVIGDFPDQFKDIAEQIKTKQGLGQAQAEGGAPQ
ncbi:MAG TPA: pilus assembly protein N-terminal domain-containing protein [Methyloceanibacter sp.]|jgi:Flp pilus assembly secretin CpaC